MIQSSSRWKKTAFEEMSKRPQLISNKAFWTPLCKENIVNLDNTCFPFRYILDNVLIQHETINHAKETKQDLVPYS